ncbi:MAG: tRNA (adenosine(37)-N6)-threonylcarbamoyltransferase complex dimerization subunit type 1 TsaB [Clostridiales bacterium]|nr:tRNA (adenosine(37)-N6)-threonylcarbamoyltransferase complex dimerization subunit type 1 TsaB [Clostridiales bacterium]
MILTIDTSTKIASVTLINQGRISYHAFLNDNKTHSEKLMPLISECFNMMQLTPQDMDAFAAVVGPGSFTGLRIGIATIQGLAFSTQKPCIAVSALDALAHSVDSFDGLIVPLIDARNAQAYSAIYDGANSHLKITDDMAKSVKTIAEDIRKMKRKAIFVGDGANVNHDIIIDILGSDAHFSEEQQDYTAAKSAAQLAQTKYDNKDTLLPANLVPYYFRNTSAKKKSERS